MMHSEQMQEVRSLVVEMLHRLGAGGASEPLESILIRNGYYCGRRFDCDGIQAIWFIEENEIKFYGRDGSVQHVCQPPATPRSASPRRVA